MNTLQSGLAAIFNPDNYTQQHSRRLPFIPGLPAYISHHVSNNFIVNVVRSAHRGLEVTESRRGSRVRPRLRQLVPLAVDGEGQFITLLKI